MKKNIVKGVGLALALIFVLPGLLALAFAWSVEFTVTESSGNSYTSVGLMASANNTYYASQGYINANGLNTHVYVNNSTVPHMLSDDKVLWATNLPANTSQHTVYALGDTAVTSFDIIPGYGGYVTTPDDSTIEPDAEFEISVSGFLDTSSAPDKNICYKQDAVRIWVSGASEISAQIGTDGVPLITLVAPGIASGQHTVSLVANLLTLSLYVDDVLKDSEAL